MKFRIIMVFLAFSHITFVAYGQTDFLTQGLKKSYDYYRLLSPSLLGNVLSPAHTQPPIASVLNPALNAAIQRIYLEAGYIGMLLADDASNVREHNAVLAVGVPFQWGVISASLHLLTASARPYAIPPTGSLHVSFAKAITEQFWFGFAVRSSIGANPIDWGLGVDMGAVYTFFPPHIPYLRLGFSLQNWGKWYMPHPNYTAFPAPFSLSVGMDAQLFNYNRTSLSFISAIEFPTFLNVLIDLGLSLKIADIFEIHGGVQIDMLSYFLENRTPSTLYPEFGISFRIPFKGVALVKNPRSDLEKGGDVQIHLSGNPGLYPIWQIGVDTTVAFGVVDTRAPAVTVTITDEERYISPNNNGVKDQLSFMLSITDERYVKKYIISIRNEQGEIIRRIKNKENRIENDFLRGFFTRLFEKKEGVSIPPRILWDGKMDNGKDAPDGAYSFTVYAEDDTGNFSETEPKVFFIDRKAPELQIGNIIPTQRIFSPNGDNHLDTVTISQRSSVEAKWQMEIRSHDGAVVKSVLMLNKKVEDFIWDGTGNDGKLLPDGVYEYVIQGIDKSGNKTQASIDNIILKTEVTPLSLYLKSTAFSPNGDGVQDVLTLIPLIGERVGIQEWELEIYSAKQMELVTSLHGIEVPESFLITGIDEKGNLLPEGYYVAKLTLVYIHGNVPEAVSPSFLLDVNSPYADVKISNKVISPNGDGIKDTILFSQGGSQEVKWEGVILSAQNKVMFRTFFYDTPPGDFLWDGRTIEGRLAPDGTYHYKLHARDLAGNYGESQTITFSIDTAFADIILTAELIAFSPNNDGKHDTIRFFPSLSTQSISGYYHFSIVSEDGTPIFDFEGEGELPEYFDWNGMDMGKQRVPDGKYRATIGVTFRSGVSKVAASSLFMLDTTFPHAKLSLHDNIFSPNSDGKKDRLTIYQESSKESEWTGVIYTQNGNIMRQYTWREQEVGDFAWDGKDDKGNLCPDAIYVYKLSSTDKAGNSVTYEVKNIVLDTTQAKLYLTLDKKLFSPLATTPEQQFIIFSFLTDFSKTMQKWDLCVLDAQKNIVWHYSENAAFVTNELRWDARTAEGKILEGKFSARLSADYANGSSPSVESAVFLIDNSAPVLQVETEPMLFSPDGDGVQDVLYFHIEAKDLAGIDRWNMQIFDRTGKLFQSFHGKEVPSKLIQWDGRADDGELVISAEDYPYRLEATDVLGHTGNVQGIVSVDVLVIRDGDMLRVRISAITFEPNSAALIINEMEEKGAKNNAVLKRLVEIFKKYKNYRILVEGHAVNVSGTEREDKEELIPLSLARAQTVKEALIKGGIKTQRIETAGRGGKNPIVPHTDLEQRWKNRRVEFILLK